MVKDSQFGDLEVTQMLRLRFYPIKLLSQGVFGEVWFALPLVAVWHYYKSTGREDNLPELEVFLTSDYARSLKDVVVQNLSDLRTHMCVVKIWFEPGCEGIEDVLQKQLRSTTMHNRLNEIGAEERFNYPRILESGRADHTCWQASSLITGFAVGALEKATDKPIAQALIAHIAIQLHDAFRWLNSTKIAVYRNDPHMFNTMLDMACRNAARLPKIALIDWDMDNCKSDDETLDDRRSLCTQLLWLMTLHRKCLDFHCGLEKGSAEDCEHDAFWLKFATAMGRAFQKDQPMTHVEFQTAFYKGLVECRDRVSEQEQKEIREILDKAMRLGPQVSDEDLREKVGPRDND